MRDQTGVRLHTQQVLVQRLIQYTLTQLVIGGVGRELCVGLNVWFALDDRLVIRAHAKA